MKDHQIATLVNALQDIALKFHGTQQLRERISQAVIAALAQQDALAKPTKQEPCTYKCEAWPQCECATQQKPVAMKTHGAWDGLELLDGLPDGTCLYAEPQPKTGPLASDQEKLLSALRRLSFAAACRDNTMGDPCRLIEVKAELSAASRHADAVIASLAGK